VNRGVVVERVKPYSAGLLSSFAIALFFLSALIGRSFFFHFDILGLHLPQRYFVARSLADGVVPFWCPDKMCGYPIFAEGQPGIFYPPNILNLVFPVWYATNLLVVLHFIFMFWGTYLLLRRELSDISSAVGGLGCAFSGFVIAHIHHLPALECAAWLPWVLWSLDGALHKGRSKVVPVIFLLLSYLAGHSHTFLIVLVAALSYALLNVFRVAEKPKYLLYVVGLAVLPFLLAAPYFLSQMELFHHSTRYLKTQAPFAFQGSLVPVQLLDLFAPGLSGDPAWADFACPVLAVWEMLLYPGLLIVLFVWAVDSKRPNGLLFLSLFFVFLLLSLGKYSAFGGVIAKIPVVGKLRDPVRWWWAAGLFLSVAAAYGFERAIVDMDRGTLKRVLFAAAVSVSVILVGAFAVVPLFEKPGLTERLPLLLSAQLGLLVLVVVLALYAIIKRDRRIAWLLFLISIVDVGRNVDRSLVLGDPNWLKLPPSISEVAEKPRVFSLFNIVPYSFFGWRDDEPRSLARFAFGPMTMNFDIPMIWGYQTASGISPLAPAWVYRFRENTRVGIRFDLETVSSLFSSSEVVMKGWDEVDSGVDGLRIYVDSDPAPYCRLAGKVWPARNDDELYAILNGEDFDPRKEAVVSGVEGLSDMDDSGVAGECEVAERWANGVRLEASSSGRALLVISETDYPGWRVWVDGRPARVVRTNGRFLGVALDEGEHEVLFRFRPTYLWWGILASLVSIAALVLLGRLRFGAAVDDAKIMQAILAVIAVFLVLGVLLRLGAWSGSLEECINAVMFLI